MTDPYFDKPTYPDKPTSPHGPSASDYAVSMACATAAFVAVLVFLPGLAIPAGAVLSFVAFVLIVRWLAG